MLHEKALAAIINKAASEGVALTARESWLTLQNWATKEGIDLKKPIDEQWKAKQSANQSQQADSDKTNKPKPTPTGGRSTRTEALTTDKSDPDENASYRDIIRQSMRDAGMDVTKL